MSIQFTTAMRDRVALMVLGQAYTNLRTEHKQLLDYSNSPTIPSSTPGGIAGDAMRVVNEWAQWLLDAGTAATVPDQWEQWVVHEAAYRLAQAVRPDRAKELWSAKEDTRRQALATFTESALTASSSTDGTYTLKDIRLFVAQVGARQEKPVCVPVVVIDREFGWCFRYLWNRANWNFRRRMVTATVATDSTVTWSMASGETFETMASRLMWFTDSAGSRIEWANGDQMAQMLAMTSPPTGRPLKFRMQRESGQTLWFFYPTPDTSYTIRAEVFITCPTLPTSATSTTEIGKFPADLRYILRDMVVARCLQTFVQSRAEGERLWQQCEDQIERLIPHYDARGVPETYQSVQITEVDQYNAAYGSGGPM